MLTVQDIMTHAPTVLPSAKTRILCVEDDADIARMLTDVLKESGFEPVSVGSGAAMDVILEQGNIDIIILDVMLPGEDGFSICRRLRATSSIPIIIATARGEEIDRVLGLEFGADDYVTKPFSSRELVARIRALLRRTESVPGLSHYRTQRLTFAGWCIDPATRVLLDPEGVKIALTSVEFDLLLAFCRNSGQVLSRERLLELVHGGQVGSIERTIDVHISRIRQKIEIDLRDPVLIKTVRLGGYMFTPDVEPE
jgi:two-component system OmpR family response regulator